MLCLDTSKVGMWLATLDTKRIKDAQAKTAIGELQVRASEVLDRWFRGTVDAAPKEPRWSGGDEEIRQLPRPTSAVATPPGRTAREILTALLAQQDQLEEMERRQAELAQTQAAQAAKVDQLLAGQQAAAMELVAPRSRVMVLPELSRRTEVVRIVRSAATASGKTFEAAWRIVYDMLRDLYHIDVRARARINKKAPLDICEELGLWDHMLAICGEYLCKPIARAGGYHA